MQKIYFLLRNQIRRVARKIVWHVLFSGGLATTLGCFYYALVIDATPITIMNQTVFGQAVLSLSFMMLGIELRREDRSEHIEDLLKAYSARLGLFPFIDILVVLLGSVVISLVICLGCVVPLMLDMAPILWIKQNVLFVILYFFFPCVSMGILGLLVSHLFTGKNVYLIAVIVWILTSSLCVYYTSPLTESSELCRLIFNVCNMGFNNYQMYQNVVTGERIELPRWIMRGFILLFFAGLYISSYKRSCSSTKVQKNFNSIYVCSVATVGLASLFYIGNHFSTFFIQFADDSYTQSITFKKGSEYVGDCPVSFTNWHTEKNITLLKTDIDLKATSQGLTAEVTITSILNKTVSGQAFTLFSGFTVDEVRVDGTQVDFERSYDGIMVTFPDQKKAGTAVEFTFFYHGYSLPSYPVNETTVQLNRAFPWIPWPGIKTMSDNEVRNYKLTEVFYIADWQRGDTVAYTLEYSGPGNIYTNLDQIDTHTYAGISNNGVSLYSGMICINNNGIDIYYPAALYQKSPAISEAVSASFSIVHEYCEMFETPILPDKPTSVVVVQMRYPMWGKIFFSPNELYSWGPEWELRMRNESSSILNNFIRCSSTEEYLETEKIIASVAIPYILNPCSGYPIDAPTESTHCFADLATISILSDKLDTQSLYTISELFKTAYFEEEDGAISEQINAILLQMNNGLCFDSKLKEIYHRLLRGEYISPEEMIVSLLA